MIDDDERAAEGGTGGKQPRPRAGSPAAGVGCGAPPEEYVCDCQGKTLDAPVCMWPYSTFPSDHVGACDGGTDAALDARPD